MRKLFLCLMFGVAVLLVPAKASADHFGFSFGLHLSPGYVTPPYCNSGYYPPLGYHNGYRPYFLPPRYYGYPDRYYNGYPGCGYPGYGYPGYGFYYGGPGYRNYYYRDGDRNHYHGYYRRDWDRDRIRRYHR